MDSAELNMSKIKHRAYLTLWTQIKKKGEKLSSAKYWQLKNNRNQENKKPRSMPLPSGVCIIYGAPPNLTQRLWLTFSGAQEPPRVARTFRKRGGERSRGQHQTERYLLLKYLMIHRIVWFDSFLSTDKT